MHAQNDRRWGYPLRMTDGAYQEWFAGDGDTNESLATAIRELMGKVQELDAEFKQVTGRLPGASRSGQSLGEIA